MKRNVIMPNIVKRPQIMDYYGIYDEVTTVIEWHFMGTGFTSSDMTFGAQTSDRQYINQYAPTKLVLRYEPNIAVGGDLISNDNVMMDLLEIAQGLKTGGEAIRDYRRVWTFQRVKGKEDNENLCVGAEWQVSAQLEDTPDNDGSIGINGNLVHFSNYTLGEFDLLTKKFTPNSEVLPANVQIAPTKIKDK